MRRLLRRNPKVGPVIWHELLHLEGWIVPARFRRLAGWRRRWRDGRRSRRAQRQGAR